MPFQRKLTAVTQDRFVQAMLAASHADTLAICLMEGDRIVDGNPGFLSLFGLESLGPDISLSALAVKGDRARLRTALDTARSQTPRRLQVAFQARGAAGSLMDVELHGIDAPGTVGDGLLAFLFDIRERRRREEQLSFLAFLDPLTGLPNRALLFDRFRETLIAAHRRGSAFALMLTDLDGFKAVNDNHGHDAGDSVLQIVGERLAASVRDHDTVARQGGDEFAVLLPNLRSSANALQIAQRMIRRVSEPIVLGADSVQVGISIGIAIYPDHAADIDSLFGAADAAMYSSKRAGKNQCQMAVPAQAAPRVPVEFLSWSEAYAVGVELIDREHRQLLDLVNQFGQDLKAGADNERLGATFAALARATEAHFATEEALMSEYSVKGREVHQDHHRHLLEDLRSLGRDLDQRSMVLTLRYLQAWLIKHIEGVDKPLGRLLQRRGL